MKKIIKTQTENNAYFSLNGCFSKTKNGDNRLIRRLFCFLLFLVFYDGIKTRVKIISDNIPIEQGVKLFQLGYKYS